MSGDFFSHLGFLIRCFGKWRIGKILITYLTSSKCRECSGGLRTSYGLTKPAWNSLVAEPRSRLCSQISSAGLFLLIMPTKSDTELPASDFSDQELYDSGQSQGDLQCHYDISSLVTEFLLCLLVMGFLKLAPRRLRSQRLRSGSQMLAWSRAFAFKKTMYMWYRHV